MSEELQHGPSDYARRIELHRSLHERRRGFVGRQLAKIRYRPMRATGPMQHIPGLDVDPLAEQNLENVHSLFEDLRSASRRLTTPHLAAELGISTETAEDMLNGRIDLTLSDLQQVAIAIDACIHFTVHERASE